MRAQTLEIASELGLSCVEEQISQERLNAASEAFITSSRRLVSAITEIDGHSMSSETPGPVTLAVHERMQARIEGAIAELSSH
jgi:branched-subunit amino acid aminotransferase/4-amino-4-deoxychorismate lyase